VWRWDQQEPFGDSAPNEDPDGDSVGFSFPVRFPGQYADAETNLAHNYFRDYDPSIGRYGKSDPIGLRGGTNTYAYVASMPLKWFDAFGLLPSGGGGFAMRYGNWCGKNWSGGRQGRIIPQNPAGPIDSVDECCMAHDYCYAAVESCKTCPQEDDSPQKLSCDRILVGCLDKLSGKPPYAWPKPPPYGEEPSNAYFFCQKAKRYFQYKLGQ